MSALVPGATYDQQQALIVKLKSKLAGVVLDLDNKFAGRTFKAADVIDELTRTASILQSKYAIQEGGTYDAVARWFSENDRNALAAVTTMWENARAILDVMTNVAGGYSVGDGFAPDHVFSSSDTPEGAGYDPSLSFWQQVYQSQRAFPVWLAGYVPPILADFSETDKVLTEAADDAANIPSITIKWLLEQLLKSLNLPTWLLPALGITAIAGLGAWAYFSFLAPITASTHVLRRNPRRRRARRRRRYRS